MAALQPPGRHGAGGAEFSLLQAEASLMVAEQDTDL